ncbi:hypothetical protein SynBIOSE41_01586 [Synechococcus sp. BIOS-E4-1]|nr:hypothetical protein SynBIOSE41_01586 [Synechococcus sp. BIOS-E4-1]
MSKSQAWLQPDAVYSLCFNDLDSHVAMVKSGMAPSFSI